MTPTRRRLLGWLGGGLVVVGVPVAGRLARSGRGPRCAHDGLPLDPRFRVRVVDADGTDRAFCCVRCGEAWLANRRRTPAAVFVTDEPTGAELPAAAAHYVRGRAVTNPVTGNRVRVFADPAAAAAHAGAFGGVELTGPDRPFSTSPGRTTE